MMTLCMAIFSMVGLAQQGAHRLVKGVVELDGVLLGCLGVSRGEPDFRLADIPDFVVLELGLPVVLGGDDLLDSVLGDQAEVGHAVGGVAEEG